VSSVFGSLSGLFARGRSAAISRSQDSFNVSLPRRARLELRPGSEVNLQPCQSGPQVCIHDATSIRPTRATTSLAASVDQTEARKKWAS
jgi:hypothetical protein